MRKITLLSVFLLLIMVKMSAQVTIGSEGQPASGSLLQLKEDNLTGTNSKKGFGLPRVALTDVAHLYPMFTPGYDVIENVNHEGLMVYNTNPNFGNGRGVYIWQNESSAFSWMSMKTKISVVDKTLAIITKASQRIVARVDDVNPKTSDVTWNGISGNNVDEISIAANGTDIYLPPFTS